MLGTLSSQLDRIENNLELPNNPLITLPQFPNKN